MRSVVLLVLAIGIAGGATLAAFAGARRTDSAVDRFVAWSKPAQGVVIGDPALYPRIERLPQVAASTRGVRIVLARVPSRGRPLNSLALENFGFSRPIVIAGRMPNPERLDEVVINPAGAANANLRVGSSVRLHAFAPQQAGAVLRGTARRRPAR
jgi:hypothetical protein